MDDGLKQAIETEMSHLRKWVWRLKEIRDEVERLERVLRDRGIPVPEAGSEPEVPLDELSGSIEAASEDIEQLQRIREGFESLERGLQTHVAHLRSALSAHR